MTSMRVAGRGRIRRDRPVRFSFDGKPYTGCDGDTVASALLANGVHLMGRSFKYHRPRGVLAAGSEEPNALVGILRGPGRFEPNTRATMQEVFEGLSAESQNRWPGLGFDVGAVNDLMHKFFAAGFYYKTFMWPRRFWDSVYEPVIRRAAGLGKAPVEPDPDAYASRYLHTDVLVAGAGPAGISAAIAAAEHGAKVVLIDENAEMGGGLLAEPDAEIDGQRVWDWLDRSMARLNDLGVSLLTRTTAIGYYHSNMVALAERLTDHQANPMEGMPRERLWRVRAGRVILAQGAIERPLVFNGNDRPGILLAGAARTYLNRFGVAVGKQVFVATAHDSAWFAAFDLADAGIAIAAIADTRPEIPEALLGAAASRGIEVLAGHAITETRGRLRVRSVTVNPIIGGRAGARRTIACDAVLMCGGWTPSLHLYSHAKGRLAWHDALGCFLPDGIDEACEVVGAARGIWGIAGAVADGTRAGTLAAGGRFGDTPILPARMGETHGELPTDRAPEKSRAFVDFQNDVMAKDLRLAVREGMRSIEHVKRYTTNGMATDQGKLSNINGLLIAAAELGKSPPEVGLTTYRPPFSPTTFGSFAGYHRNEHFDATRKTPTDAWAEAHGAVFEPVGQWRRAWYFPNAGEDMHAAVARECIATRNSLGMFDASTLGKIEVVGPDVVEFMNRMYTNPWTKLAPGRCRYGLLLGEDGYIRDDGVIGRLAMDRFHVTTTTSGAPRVMNMMEDYLQTEWPDLDVWLTSISEQWATIALNGPNSRRLLEPLVTGLDLSAAAFPHMSVAECLVAGIPARLFRVSFTGELGFEVNVPSRYGGHLWELLYEEGRRFDLCPYGTEAMHLMRAEKGFIIVGQDTDGTVTPHDAGLGWAIGKNKPDFVGRRSLSRPDLVASGRKQLVGLLTEDPNVVLEEGAQVVVEPHQPVPMRMIGHVTSAYRSATLKRSIAMALVEDGHERMGEPVYIPMPDATHRATVTSTVFYDPDGERLNL